MTFTLFAQTRLALLLAISCSLFGCRQTDEEAVVTQTENSAATAVANSQTPARPAPEFFLVPPDMAKNRVWICVDESVDVFHTRHDCPVLVQCKGSFRNLTLLRAIEDFGRYNCQECSRDLDHIFDEDMVR